MLTAPPPIGLSPITMDSGMPSSRASTAIATPLSELFAFRGLLSSRSLSMPRALPGKQPIGERVDHCSAQETRAGRIETAAPISSRHQIERTRGYDDATAEGHHVRGHLFPKAIRSPAAAPISSAEPAIRPKFPPRATQARVIYPRLRPEDGW
jgi:hypothetical protein